MKQLLLSWMTKYETNSTVLEAVKRKTTLADFVELEK